MPPEPGQTVTVHLIDGDRMTGAVVAVVEDFRHIIPEAYEHPTLPVPALLREITIAYTDQHPPLGGARVWHYRIPASAIVWVTYPAPQEGKVGLG